MTAEATPIQVLTRELPTELEATGLELWERVKPPSTSPTNQAGSLFSSRRAGRWTRSSSRKRPAVVLN